MNTADSDSGSPETTDCSCSTQKCQIAAWQQCDMQTNSSTYATRKADLEAAIYKTNAKPTDISSNQKTQHSNRIVQTCMHDLDTGSATAMYKLACCCINNSISDESVHQIAKHAIFKMKLNELARNYALGFLEPNNDQETFLVFKHAEFQNDPDVLCAFGRCYNYGWGVEKDIIKAIKSYVKAADAGSYEAMQRLENCKRENVDEHLKLAFQHFKQQADDGSANAQFAVGYCYQASVGVEQNLDLAAQLLVMAANRNCTNAIALLGQQHQFGLGVNQNSDKAVELYARAAELGNSEAQRRLAQHYKDRINSGEALKQAMFWFEKAAGQGHSEAALGLGYCHEYCRDGQNDESEAFQCYRQAALAGSGSGQYEVGMCYQNGKGTKQSYKNAIRWYEKAAGQGYINAVYPLDECRSQLRNRASGRNLGVLQYSTNNTAENVVSEGLNAEMPSFKVEIAFLLAKLAAADQCQEAFKLLGDCYYFGVCVDRDFNSAAENYELASLTDYTALLRLAYCYLAAESDYGEISVFSALRLVNAALKVEISEVAAQML